MLPPYGAWVTEATTGGGQLPGGDRVVVRSHARRRHELVDGYLLFLNYVKGATLAGSGSDSLAVYRTRRLGWMTADMPHDTDYPYRYGFWPFFK